MASEHKIVSDVELNLEKNQSTNLAYNALQSRLDHYRSAAIATAGGAIAFLSIIYSILVNNDNGSIALFKKILILLLSGTIGIVALAILREIQRNFKSMSAIIITIDHKLGFFSPDFDKYGSLYPEAWDSLSRRGNKGWADFVIRKLTHTMFIVTFITLYFVSVTLFNAELAILMKDVEYQYPWLHSFLDFLF